MPAEAATSASVVWSRWSDASATALAVASPTRRRATATPGARVEYRLESADGAARVRPQTWTPPRNASGKGRTPVRVRVHPDRPAPLRVDALAAQLPADQWRRYRALEGSRGPLVVDFAALRAVAVREGLPGPEVWIVLRRPLVESGEQPDLKYFLANAPADTPLATLVRVSGMRWPIESCFEEARRKSASTTTSCASGGAGITT